MKYDLSKEIDKKAAVTRFEYLCKIGAVVDLTKVDLTKERKKRTIQQNKYLHVLFDLWGIEYGYTSEESKMVIKGQYPYGHYEKNGINFPVSTSKFSTEEMTQFIDWFRNWSSNNGFYLPSSQEYIDNKYFFDRQIENAKQWL